eukprot:TRINITY_DN2405_c0_g1_i1.p1 TRINITY_DN2405_c0_g1~~TRINITY_DN2405_c0_g1_i1.p1  ORF type:complete len:275 (-),score=43.00 TRINITY_DN2405_c0_g1_i1:59-802(-)
MAVTRLQMQRNKKENTLKLQRREIANLLQQGKEESARIKVEVVIRDAYVIEAYEIIALFCDLVCTRIQLLVESRSCPLDMKEAVSSLIWCAPRVENLPELLTIREQLARKFGKEFALSASENSEMAVNQKVYYRLSLQVPEPFLCLQTLKDIAKQFDVEWDGDAEGLPVVGMGSNLTQLPDAPPPPGLPFPPPLPPQQHPGAPYYPPAAPFVGDFPPPPIGGAPVGGPNEPDFSDLEARFAALKKGL